ncbi:DUF2264 domain-containing protein [Zunongwangia sp. SCSIO 43204]|uniref:DUF2264 domain-containing protein n=1 Tax=Zunongwangia sp. SCSIO 43204 TaxID=2779359 RepID=UPI001CA8B0FA|nr:DUF2264 domain-containing protein [Zunongwangia sp. SCSIO 43204]UAB84251.1 DUF2264 domain-containing protein [Zunongwangia sp. SCSIO 43204]
MFKLSNISFLLSLLFLSFNVNAQEVDQPAPKEVREFYVNSLVRIADPVLSNLAKGKLKENMPIERSLGAWDDRTHVTYLEAFGRTLSGIAPWLELGPDDTKEGKIRKKYIELAQKAIDKATDPESADFMNFNKDRQPLVDAAFFAQGLLRAPKQLWEPLSETTKKNVIKALKSSREIEPYYSNWLLFTGMVEAALLKFDKSADMVRLSYPINKHMEWYLGDGMYGDGPDFHWDYYNSFVIQPMLLDILKAMDEAGVGRKDDFKKVQQRAQRYASIQERLISPGGTYPPIGRSLAYRFGAFQSLSQVALWKNLSKELKPSQVRAALYAVIKRQIEAEGTFDKEGWLQVGLVGHQNNIGEGYISTGSLYLSTEAFLVLGLSPEDEFWTAPAKSWTQMKIWSGKTIPIDHAH